jgi:hypothetical protein
MGVHKAQKRQNSIREFYFECTATRVVARGKYNREDPPTATGTGSVLISESSLLYSCGTAAVCTIKGKVDVEYA